MKDGKNVGELFSNYYDTDYNEELNNYIRTSKNIRNYFNVGYLIKSANMFAKNYNPEITEFLEKPEVQNALWQTVSENIKNIKQEKLAKKQADVEIYKHKLNEAKAEFKALQTECNALQENLNNDDLTF